MAHRRHPARRQSRGNISDDYAGFVALMNILIFQHLDIEHPGVFRNFWCDDQHRLTTVELDTGHKIPSLDGFDLLAVMGGPQDVWQNDLYPWLEFEKAAIRRWVRDLGKPYLGICLGHQLLADALGGKVSLMQRPEVGIAKVSLTREGLVDPILNGFPPEVDALQWHGAEVAEPPEGSVVLASNDACRIQAIRYGRHAYGFQYHCEIEKMTVAAWEQIPEYKTSLVDTLGADGAKNLAKNVSSRLRAFTDSARLLNDNLMKIIQKAAAIENIS
jgi:GMP synthase-like glutamine amidotransferase